MTDFRIYQISTMVVVSGSWNKIQFQEFFMLKKFPHTDF